VLHLPEDDRCIDIRQLHPSHYWLNCLSLMSASWGFLVWYAS
jgi:hypothetical protein